MSLLDDIVKLQFGKPLREAIREGMNSIIAKRSAPVLQDFLQGLQFGEDGSMKPGGMTQLDLNKPETMNQLMSKITAGLANLTGVSGGRETTQFKQGKDISDMILDASIDSRQVGAQERALRDKPNKPVRDPLSEGFIANLYSASDKEPQISEALTLGSDVIRDFLNVNKTDTAGFAKHVIAKKRKTTVDKIADDDAEFLKLSFQMQRSMYGKPESAEAIAERERRKQVLEKKAQLLMEWNKMDAMLPGTKKNYLDMFGGKESLAREKYFEDNLKVLGLTPSGEPDWIKAFREFAKQTKKPTSSNTNPSTKPSNSESNIARPTLPGLPSLGLPGLIDALMQKSEEEGKLPTSGGEFTKEMEEEAMRKIKKLFSKPVRGVTGKF